MSLINEMLRDLEARGSNNEERHLASPPPPPVRRSRTPAVLFGAVALFSLCAIAWYLWPLEETARAAPAVASTDEMGMERTELASAPVTEPVVVTDPVAQASPPVAEATATPDELADETASPDARVAVVAPEPPAPARTKTSVPVEKEHATQADEPESVIVRRHEPTAADRAARAARDGFTALRNGDWATASRLLQELVAAEPANDDAREGLAIALARQGRIAESDSVLLDGLAVGTQPARFAKLRARLQSARGDLASALDTLSLAVPPVAEDLEFHALKAAIAQQAGNYALAEAVYQELTAVQSGNATWQAGLGIALDAQSKSEAARVAFQRALDAGGLEVNLLAHVQQRVRALQAK